MRHLVAAADLLVGAACPACGAPGLTVCGACARSARPAPFAVTTSRQAEHLAVTAAGAHRGILRRVVIEWKEQGRSPLTSFLAHHLAASVAAAVNHDEITLVPVPGSRAARWRRGDDVVLSLAFAAAGLLAEVGQRATVAPVLTRTRRTAVQSGLGAEARARNLQGAFAMDRRRALPADRAVVLVDDIVTTGSTLAEAARALVEAGLDVHDAATVAATSAAPLAIRGAAD